MTYLYDLSIRSSRELFMNTDNRRLTERLLTFVKVKLLSGLIKGIGKYIYK